MEAPHEFGIGCRNESGLRLLPFPNSVMIVHTNGHRPFLECLLQAANLPDLRNNVPRARVSEEHWFPQEARTA